VKRCLVCDGGFESRGWTCPCCAASPVMTENFPTFAPGLSVDFDSAHFERLAAVEDGHFWFRARGRLIAALLARYFSSARRFLEIGCGTGSVLATVSARFPAMTVVGADACHRGLGIAARRLAPGTELCQIDAGRIPFIDEFDVVGAFDVLEHVHDDLAVLGEIFRAVRAGGGAVLSVPQHPWLWSGTDVVAGHRRRYRRSELEEKATAVGFTVVRSTAFVTLLLPVLLASRLRPGARASHEPELAPPGWVNRALEKVLVAEIVAIRAGVSFPVGGSRFVVVRKGHP
jgi:SAM-dependent methyltransferase